MKVNIEIKGMDDLLSALDEKKAITGQVFNIVSDELIDAVLVKGGVDAPVRTGYLRRSRYVYPHITANSFTVEAGFRASYAEIVDRRHGTKAGFFTGNVVEAIHNIKRRVKAL